MSVKRFMGWRDLIITPVVEIMIVGASIELTRIVNHWWPLDIILRCVTFYASQAIIAIILLKGLRVFFPLRPGIYSIDKNPDVFFRYNLNGFLLVTNLGLFFVNGLVPLPFRKLFYWCLGATTGSGIMALAGRLFHPVELVSVDEGVILGEGALVLPHAQLMNDRTDLLILGRVRIQRNAIIGANVLLMPGVVVGENAMVTAMSLVPMNTRIPPNEIWGGQPAKKIGTIEKELVS